MTTLAIPKIPQNQANGEKPAGQALVDSVNWKVGNVGQCVAAHREHIITLYKEHNKAVEHTNAAVNKMLKELNANVIKTLVPQISEAARRVLEKDPELLSMLAQAIIRDQGAQIERYEARLKQLEKKVEELTTRARL